MRSKINEIVVHNSGPTRVKDYVDIGYQYEVNKQSFETTVFATVSSQCQATHPNHHLQISFGCKT